MPIKIPDALPATDVLEGENIFVMTEFRAMHQDIRPLKVLLLNLMPTKIVTDTQMALSGISKPALKKLGCQAVCFMADEDIAREAKARETTRARVSMERALAIPGSKLLVCGNAPTFLEPLENHADLKNTVVIGVPVGFVHVVEAKEMLLKTGLPCIVARGRRGGSNVAAAIVNALLYGMEGVRA